MGAWGRQPRTQLLGAAPALGLAVLSLASPVSAATVGRHHAATVGGVHAVVASTRPLCRFGWHLRGSKGHGFICTRRGHKQRPSCRPHQQLHARGRGNYVCLPTPVGSPTPQATAPTTSAPAPSPNPTQTMEQYLVNGAFEYAKYYAEKELAEAVYNHVYYWKIEPNGCALIAPNRAECVVLIYKNVEVINNDQTSVANYWVKAIYLLGVFYEYQGPELGYRARLGQIGDWNVGPWMWL